MKFLTATTYSESWQRVYVEDTKVHALPCMSTSSPRVYVQGFFLSRVQISQQRKYVNFIIGILVQAKALQPVVKHSIKVICHIKPNY